METIKQITLDINKKYYEAIIAKQGDVGSRFIQFQLLDNSTYFNLTNNTVKLFAKKSDGTIVFTAGTIISATEGKVKVELTSQTLALVGNVDCELVIYSADSKKLSTITFVVSVLAKINDDAAIESANEFTALTEALSVVTGIENKAEKTYVDENFTEINSQLADNTIQQKIEKTNNTPNNANELGSDTLWIKMIYQGVNTTPDVAPYVYEGSAIHARTVVGGGDTLPVGTTHGISSHIKVLTSGSSQNEVAPLFLDTTVDKACRIWGTDFNVNAPITEQADLIMGQCTRVGVFNNTPVPNKSMVGAFVTRPGTGGGDGAGARNTLQSYPLDIGVAVVGFSGTPDKTTFTNGYNIGLQIGGYASGWMLNTDRSRLNIGIKISDTVGTGLKFEKLYNDEVMQICQTDTSTLAWSLTTESNWLVFRDRSVADNYHMAFIPNGDVLFQKGAARFDQYGTLKVSNTKGLNVSIAQSATSITVTLPNARANANYTVFVTPTWTTTCKVYNKTTTGFEIGFGTAVPIENQTFDWFIVA